MTIFICLDDADGLAFNHRRQSRDRVLCEHIAALSQKGVLRMNTSSFPLFSGINAPNICAEDEFMQHAQPNDFCFFLRMCGSEIAIRIPSLARGA